MSFLVYLLEEEKEKSRYSIYYHLILTKKTNKQRNGGVQKVICRLFVYFRLNSAITMSFTGSDCGCGLQSAQSWMFLSSHGHAIPSLSYWFFQWIKKPLPYCSLGSVALTPAIHIKTN